jgi:hypothetical protein
VIPVRLGLHADAGYRSELALDSEQPLDQALRFLIAALAEVLVSDSSVRVDEVQRRPVMIVESAPDRVSIVDRDRIVDRSLVRCPTHRSIWCSNENSGVWTPITISPSPR